MFLRRIKLIETHNELLTKFIFLFTILDKADTKACLSKSKFSSIFKVVFLYCQIDQNNHYQVLYLLILAHHQLSCLVYKNIQSIMFEF